MNAKGFTLIEALVVVGIIALLMALIVPAMRHQWIGDDGKLRQTAFVVCSMLKTASAHAVAHRYRTGVFYDVYADPPRCFIVAEDRETGLWERTTGVMSKETLLTPETNLRNTRLLVPQKAPDDPDDVLIMAPDLAQEFLPPHPGRLSGHVFGTNGQLDTTMPIKAFVELTNPAGTKRIDIIPITGRVKVVQ